MNRDSEYSLLLLAGGKSSRMGRDKAELLFEGKTFLQQLLDKAAQAGIRKKYLSGHEGAGKDAELQTVKDRYRERGPLGGASRRAFGCRNPVLYGASGGCSAASRRASLPSAGCP